MRFNIVVDSRHGTFIVNRLDAYLCRSIIEYGEFSQGEVELFEELISPGDIVIDAGANIGHHTVVLSRLAKLVLAFEPQPIVYQTLCGNLAINSIVNVQPYQMALGSEVTTIKVPVLDPQAPNNFGGLDIRRQSPACVSVPIITLDSLKLQSCRFIKCDVEGMELEVLRGAIETMRKHRPIVYVENDRPDNSDELIQFLTDDNRTLYHHIVPLFRLDNHTGMMTNIFQDVASLNVLAWPTEQPMNLDLARFGLVAFEQQQALAAQ